MSDRQWIPGAGFVESTRTVADLRRRTEHAELVELLKAHGLRQQQAYSWTHPVTGQVIAPYWKCACGDGGDVPDGVRFVLDCHRAHVAAVLQEWVAHR